MKFQIIQDKKIGYQAVGNKENPTILLIHGFPECSHIFDRQIADLQKEYYIIVPDLPGVGQSDYNDKLNTVEDFATCLYDILIAEQVKKCVVMGHSMGGYIALAMAEKFPILIEGIGLIHSTAFADSEEKKEKRVKSITLMRKYGGAKFVEKAIAPLFSEKNRIAFQSEIETLTNTAKGFDTNGLIRFYEIMIQRPDRTKIFKLNIPFFFFIGKEDQSAPLSDLQKQFILPNVSSICIVNEIAHMGMLEASTLLNHKMKAFMQLSATLQNKEQA